MTRDKIIETMAKAMSNSKAWHVVFASGSADELSRAALSALEASGLVVVPREASDAMVYAALKSSVQIMDAEKVDRLSPHDETPRPSIVTRTAYSAMISAALGEKGNKDGR